MTLRTIYQRLPAPLRRLGNPALHCYRFFRGLRVELWSVQGDERHSGLPLSVLCALPSKQKSYVVRLMFGESFRERCLGRVWIWKIPRAAENAGLDYSMTLVKADSGRFRSWTAKGWFVIPFWVEGTVELPLSLEVRKSETVLSDLRRIKKNGLDFEVTRDPHWLEIFYNEMYVPFMNRKYGDRVQIDSSEELKIRFQDGELLLIKSGAEHIAGVLLTNEGSYPMLWVSGIRDRGRDYRKEGLAAAIYHLSFAHLQEKGFTKAGLGWSRPFLNDGVLRFKHKLSQQITGSSLNGMALKISSYTAATRSFLQNNPFMFEGTDGLCGAIFLEAEAPLDEAMTHQLNKEYGHRGLVRLCTYRLPQAGSSERKLRSTSARSVLQDPQAD